LDVRGALRWSQMVSLGAKIAFFVSLIAIEYLATTSLTIKPIEMSWDKANHFIAFITLYVTLSLGYQTLTVRFKALTLLLYGVQIELIQSLLPHRFFSLLDIVADGVGIALGVVVMSFVVPRFWGGTQTPN